VLAKPEWQGRLTAVDLRALSPLKWQHVNPYGTFALNMRERLPLEQVAFPTSATLPKFRLRYLKALQGVNRSLTSACDAPTSDFLALSFETATVTIRGIELAEKIKKNQFNIRALTEKIATAPQLWSAVLAA
jgi:hypothetical protein